MTTRFHAFLEKKIEEEIQNRAASLASGAAADYPHYKESVGYINGVKAAIKLCDDVEQDMGNERSDTV